MPEEFQSILDLIVSARKKAFQAINRELIDLYWTIGEHISKKIACSEWGSGVVSALANYIQNTAPELKGFSDKNLWRMKQFYESYRDFPILSTLSREVSWSHNLAIFSRCETPEEREFYLRLSKQEAYSFRELDRQISSSIFERTILQKEDLSTALREIGTGISFRDRYVFEFLNLPEKHDENELKSGLISQLKQLILELGKDFLFIGKEHRIQVGASDFFIDLLFYHRSLQCLVAFELKADKFKPEYLGQLNFYLEALDRDVKKPNENPSLGILLCKDKDIEVVEYALSRSLSPTLIAEYKTKLPDKVFLQKQVRKIFDNNPSETN